ncbi:MAG: aspartate aminotransferase [Candidatus Wallbacteria bacterium HGW-Wallbacteria-1]|uniref:Aminotransferase n=1 Tax=Candidatus Wallbacteria bacterium HGW-Wallbacteria-1 TaxID=2013854 RepID=A0A2N1PQG5_9BACT|nr:MAG: aspartate aminotransferase [Candidatus Wallbacteria bacterium HGW-Wallbacteria-1]
MAGKGQVSDRALGMQESPIRKLTPLADRAKEKGVRVYHLNVGQPDIDTPGAILDRAQTISDRIIRYSPSPGEKTLLNSLVSYFDKFCGIKLDSSEIMVTVGGSEAIIFAMMSICDPGDEIIVFEPYYTNYNGFASMAGVTLVPVSTSIENNFGLPEMSEVEAKISDRTRAILLCNPNNPTGMVYSRARLQALSDLALRHDIFILSDEVYREFVYDGTEHISILDFPELRQRAILMDSFSKRYSFCGGRIGCLITHNSDVMSNCMKFAQARLSVSFIDQMAACGIDLLDNDYYTEVVAEYCSRRDVVYEGLRAIEGVYCNKAPGAFYSMARLPIDDSENFARWLLSDFSHQGETVMVSPAPGFYATPGRGKQEIRIAYVLNTLDLTRAMELLGLAIQKYPGRSN